MSAPPENEQLRRIQERFTRTVDDFSSFALAKRAVDADRLVALALNGLAGRVQWALDVACGPGTFARSVAAHARNVLGVDYTAAMLAKARNAMVEARFENVRLVRGDGNHLPVADGALDLAVCGFSFHHFADPVQPLREMARVVRRGGRVGVADIHVPDGCHADANNRVERARDASHARTLTAPELQRMFEAAGLAVLAAERDARPRVFDDWMKNVSQPPGSPVYQATRALMEKEIGRDTTGFRPHWKDAAGGAIEFVQPSFFIVGEKL